MEEHKTQPKEHPPRRMTILRGYKKLCHSTKEIPYVLLKGDWMHNAGFCPGDKIVIVVNLGKLEIHKDRYA